MLSCVCCCSGVRRSFDRWLPLSLTIAMLLNGVLYSIKPRKKQQCILAFSSRQLSVFLAKQRVIVHLLVFEFDLFDDVPSLGC